MKLSDRIFVAGHKGLVGSAINDQLRKSGYENILTATKTDLDLRNQEQVNRFFAKEKIDYVFLAAAKVGGILANSTYPADFIYDNIMIECNVLHASYINGITKLLFLGSSCIYPRDSKQPIKEEYLLTNSLEDTNRSYAVAKIAGIIMCQSYNQQYGTNFISAMPTNLYGPNDNFDLNTSHVLPALLRKIHEAKINNEDHVTIWGTGNPLREFLYIEDLADACIFLMKNFSESEIINIGVGKDISIKDLTLLIKDIVGYGGSIQFDLDKPDGTPRKLLDVTKLTNLGWKSKISLKEGISKSYEWYVRTLT